MRVLLAASLTPGGSVCNAQAALHAAEDAQGALRKRLAEAERRAAEVPALREEGAELAARLAEAAEKLAAAEAAPAALAARDAEIGALHRCAQHACSGNPLFRAGMPSQQA
jgi:chromosome segregation ATPase